VFSNRAAFSDIPDEIIDQHCLFLLRDSSVATNLEMGMLMITHQISGMRAWTTWRELPPTAERRLGVNLDSIITYLFICPTCWQVHDGLTLYDEDFPEQCGEEDCGGILYTTKLFASGNSKRKSTKVLPYVAPRRAIQHWLIRPGKYQELQQWRRDGDEPRQVPATHAGGDNAFADSSNPMHDIHDAWGWRAIRAGLQRVYYDNGQLRVSDYDVHNLQQRFVSLPCGLVWKINLDWYVIHPLPDIEGSHQYCTSGSRLSNEAITPRGHSTRLVVLILVVFATLPKRLF
jgi:hypothetical protein